jgi:hypothetical protein
MLASSRGLDYIGGKAAQPVRCRTAHGRLSGGAMLNLFQGFESDITLQATLLILGCATFVGVLVCSRCPDCGWFEWVRDLRGRDDDAG